MMGETFELKVPATLVRRYVGRLVDISSAGCLIEIAAPLTLGSVGRLEALIEGQLHAEAVRVARIHPPAKPGASAQVGLEFLLVSPAGVTSIRTAIHRLTAGADAIIKFVH
jgi:hypothetical protein